MCAFLARERDFLPAQGARTLQQAPETSRTPTTGDKYSGFLSTKGLKSATC